MKNLKYKTILEMKNKRPGPNNPALKAAGSNKTSFTTFA
jgi:hypothetical protein